MEYAFISDDAFVKFCVKLQFRNFHTMRTATHLIWKFHAAAGSANDDSKLIKLEITFVQN